MTVFVQGRPKHYIVFNVNTDWQMYDTILRAQCI